MHSLHSVYEKNMCVGNSEKSHASGVLGAAQFWIFY